MVTGPLVVELTIVKGWFFNVGQTCNPSLAWKIANVFKINDDDDDNGVKFA